MDTHRCRWCLMTVAFTRMMFTQVVTPYRLSRLTMACTVKVTATTQTWLCVISSTGMGVWIGGWGEQLPRRNVSEEAMQGGRDTIMWTTARLQNDG